MSVPAFIDLEESDQVKWFLHIFLSLMSRLIVPVFTVHFFLMSLLQHTCYH